MIEQIEAAQDTETPEQIEALYDDVPTEIPFGHVDDPIRALQIVGRTDHTIVRAGDVRSRGGAPAIYYITGADDEIIASVAFNTTLPSAGHFDGVTNEDLANIVIHRLRCFQAGEFPCEENDQAITFFKMGLDALYARAGDRRDRAVKGQYKQ